MRRMLFGLALSAAAATMPGWAMQAKGAQAPDAGVQGKVANKNAEVERLQRDVAAQEAKSQEADQKMQQQDQAIVELQRQLRQLKDAGASSGKRP